MLCCAVTQTYLVVLALLNELCLGRQAASVSRDVKTDLYDSVTNGGVTSNESMEQAADALGLR
jgi:hypothetical protein